MKAALLDNNILPQLYSFKLDLNFLIKSLLYIFVSKAIYKCKELRDKFP